MSARIAVGEQVRLVAGLRWRLFRNSLRTLRGRLDAVSQALLWVLMGGLMFGGGFTVGLAAYFFIARGEPNRIGDLFWAVFLFWQLYPLLGGVGGAQFDFSNLLRFPLRYGSFFTLSLSYGLFEPAAVISLFWLICLSVGVTAARPGLYLWTLFVALAFAAMNLGMSRAVATWADRWMAQRRTREILGFIVIVTILAVQFAIPLLSDWHPGKRAESWLAPLASATHALPPGFAAAALDASLAANRLRTLANILFVGLYAAAFLWLLHWRLAAQYRGENLSEARFAPRPAGHDQPGVSVATRNWTLPWRSTVIAALVEREARYTMRNWQVLFQILIPAIFVVAFGSSLKDTAFFVRHRDMVFPFALCYVFFMLENWFFNSLAYEGAGIRLLFLAPVGFRQVMLGKNLFQAAVTLVNVLFLWIFVRWTLGSPGSWIVAATLVASIYALLVNLAAGNIISVYCPVRREFGFGNFRRGRAQGGMGALAGLATDIGLVATGALVFLVGKLLDRMGLAVLIFLALAAAAAVGYALSLRAIDRIALSRREALIQELCQPETAT
jgi:ABC-2 type transport system permease protein